MWKEPEGVMLASAQAPTGWKGAFLPTLSPSSLFFPVSLFERGTSNHPGGGVSFACATQRLLRLDLIELSSGGNTYKNYYFSQNHTVWVALLYCPHKKNTHPVTQTGQPQQSIEIDHFTIAAQ